MKVIKFNNGQFTPDELLGYLQEFINDIESMVVVYKEKDGRCVTHLVEPDD